MKTTKTQLTRILTTSLIVFFALFFVGCGHKSHSINVTFVAETCELKFPDKILIAKIKIQQPHFTIPVIIVPRILQPVDHFNLCSIDTNVYDDIDKVLLDNELKKNEETFIQFHVKNERGGYDMHRIKISVENWNTSGQLKTNS